MVTAVVSLKYITMGRLYSRRRHTPERLAELTQSSSNLPPVDHWTLRLPSGCVIVEVHPNENAWRKDFVRSNAMFRDPVHRFSTETFAFIDEDREALALQVFSRARQALAAESSNAIPSTSDQLMGRLVSLSRLPRLPADVHESVWSALGNHQFSSIVQLGLSSPSGELLLDAYLDEDRLIDDFLFVYELLKDSGYELRNEWYPFTDRVHESSLDRLAYGLGLLPATTG
jgi:hypothetical protein